MPDSNLDQKRNFTADEIRQAVQEALENWDWDEAKNPEVEKARLQETADMADEIVDQQGESGIFTLNQAYNNVWDWLSERSK